MLALQRLLPHGIIYTCHIVRCERCEFGNLKPKPMEYMRRKTNVDEAREFHWFYHETFHSKSLLPCDIFYIYQSQMQFALLTDQPMELFIVCSEAHFRCYRLFCSLSLSLLFIRLNTPVQFLFSASLI